MLVLKTHRQLLKRIEECSVSDMTKQKGNSMDMLPTQSDKKYYIQTLTEII